MATIICVKCGKGVEVPEVKEGQDNSTFVCEACAEKVNLPAYKAELAELESKADKTESEGKRVEFLKAKIAALEE